MPCGDGGDHLCTSRLTPWDERPKCFHWPRRVGVFSHTVEHDDGV
jgi:hypothetical protein